VLTGAGFLNVTFNQDLLPGPYDDTKWTVVLNGTPRAVTGAANFGPHQVLLAGSFGAPAGTPHSVSYAGGDPLMTGVQNRFVAPFTLNSMTVS